MSRLSPINITTNGTVKIASVRPPRGMEHYGIEIHLTGNFGGGSVSIFRSLDDGVTKIYERTLSGGTYNITGNDYVPIKIYGWSATNGQDITLHAETSGATTPSITLTAFDNV